MDSMVGRLQKAKDLLAEETPLVQVARMVKISPARLRREAEKHAWLRRTRKDAYPMEVREEALAVFRMNGSLSATARMLGVDRKTLTKWLVMAEKKKTSIPRTPRWRCYCSSAYGRELLTISCPDCGSLHPALAVPLPPDTDLLEEEEKC